MLTYRWILSTKTLLLKGRGIKVTILVDLSHASFLICFSPSLANWEHDYQLEFKQIDLRVENILIVLSSLSLSYQLLKKNTSRAEVVQKPPLDKSCSQRFHTPRGGLGPSTVMVMVYFRLGQHFGCVT